MSSAEASNASELRWMSSLDANSLRMLLLRSLGGIAQLVERLVRNEKVRGSNPLTSTNFLPGSFKAKLGIALLPPARYRMQQSRSLPSIYGG